jgi:hypothetical protein
VADWKDFYEDNKETLGQFLDALAAAKGSKAARTSPTTPPIQFCPLCHAAFFDDIEIAHHVQKTHGPQHIYLRVNGQIIRDIGWADQGISQLRLVLLGFSQASVEIAGLQIHKTLKVVGDESLKRLIPTGFEGELEFRVEPSGGSARQFTIYSRSLPHFRRESLDALIQSLSEQDTKLGGVPDIGKWRELAGDMGVLENRYLNGFFEYVLGFHLTKSGQSDRAKQHFEDAFGLLLPFRTPMAHSAQCVLGLRMNCFGVLARAPRKSVASASDQFFNQPFPSRWVRPTTCEEASPFMTYADEFTIRLVKVVADFYNRDSPVCGAGLEALEFHPSGKEKNNEDKLLILRARLHRQGGRPGQARATYEMLRYHPVFGTEAEEYLNG